VTVVADQLAAQWHSTFVTLDSLRIDGGTQPRAAINEETVAEFASKMREDVSFEPIAVFFDGVDSWLADGFHRYHAARAAGRSDLRAVVHEGTRREAVLYSVGANVGHDTNGRPRTNADKRKSVMTLLEDAEWAQWSDHEIARRCGVVHSFVNGLRQSSPFSKNSEPRRFKTKHGTEAVMDVSGIQAAAKERAATPKASKRTLVEDALEADPAATNKRIARHVGCIPSFVSKVRNELGLPAVRGIGREQGTAERVERFAQAMNGLQGFVLGFKGLPIENLAADPRAQRWVEQLTELIHALRETRKAIGGPNGK
jgi:hypothetical protein